MSRNMIVSHWSTFRVLMRLKNLSSFPLEMIVDVGVRNFKVRLEDDGGSHHPIQRGARTCFSDG